MPRSAKKSTRKRKKSGGTSRRRHSNSSRRKTKKRSRRSDFVVRRTPEEKRKIDQLAERLADVTDKMERLGFERNEAEEAYEKFLQSGVGDAKLKKRLETRLLEAKERHAKVIDEHENAYDAWADAQTRAYKKKHAILIR